MREDRIICLRILYVIPEGKGQRKVRKMRSADCAIKYFRFGTISLAHVPARDAHKAIVR